MIMNTEKLLLLFTFLFLSTSIWAQDQLPKRVYETTSIQNERAPKIDGLINDEVWNKVSWSGEYVEWSPEENTSPTEQTMLKILYDDKNLYVAFKCLDKDPKGVVRRLSRRDGFDGDWVEINIDSNNDESTAFSFTITAAGVKGEEFVSNNGAFWDNTWNPIWYAKTNVDEEGWTAEIKIPLSQIRFGDEENQVWGIQSTRRYFRSEERSVWQRSPQNSAGWVSDFGELRGLKNLRPQKQVEIQPYSVTSLETYEAESGNPFRDGSDWSLNAGVDGKIGVTSDLKLDFTINPDFGQVEADPSAIALDGFQIFFPEQRPFFIESKNIFDYRISNSVSGSTFGFDNLFYSRRIGRAPQGFPSVGAGEFFDRPTTTSILGAAKFSGKTSNGWSIGILESITQQEKATIEGPGGERRETVEPFTNYTVGRIQKDFNNNNSSLGGIFTSTNRDITPETNFLHSNAYTGGLDFNHQWEGRTWYLRGNLITSYVEGSKEALIATQRSITHLFQREGDDDLSVDSTRTSLSGTGGNIQFGKASGNWRFQAGTTWRSPGLELNDVGFQLRANDIRQYNWIGYRTTKALKRVRQYNVNLTQVNTLDFSGNFNEFIIGLNGWVNFKNNMWLNGGIGSTPVRYSNVLLRGGPRFRQPGENRYRIGYISDSRKKVRLNANHSSTFGRDEAFYTFNLSGQLTYQPTNALQVSLAPSYSYNNDKLQFVTTRSFSGESKYILSEIEQKTLSFPLRIDYIIRPDLSIQYWGQPFISRGRYSSFKRVTNPIASALDNQFEEFETNQISYATGVYSIDEDRDGIEDYAFFEPDFAFVQFRSNLVLRWEYVPGSELFLVWSQDVSQFGDFNESLFEGLENNILNTKPQNIFLVKFTYRFIR